MGKKDLKLLGIDIDNELKFNKHGFEFCSKADRKLSVLASLSKSVSFRKQRTLFERALRIVYNEFQSTFEQIFLKDNYLSIHDQNIQRLFIEIHKALHNILTNIYGDLFIRNNHNLNLRCRLELKVPSFSSQLK